MKKNLVPKNIRYLSVLPLFLFLLFFTSCMKNEAHLLTDHDLGSGTLSNAVAVGSSNSGVNYQILYAGQNINAGQVYYDDVDTNGDQVDDAFQVTIQTANGWELMGVQFFIGASLSDLPVNKSGNPQPGQFPYKSGPLSGTTKYELTIPFSVLGFSCPRTTTGDYYVAVHCGLRKPLGDGLYQTETGWGNGLRLVQRGNWAMYSMVFITCDVNDPPVPATTETAFAFDGDPTGCFQNYSLFLDNPQRWGWTNGTYGPGTYIFRIYAGAGLCDTTKGVLVGSLIFTYNGSSATVTYQISGTDPNTDLPYSLREAHLYVGAEEFPKLTTGSQAGQYTIAPGKYPLKASGLTGQSHTFTVNNLSGNVYLIAHAVVYGFPES